MKAKAKHQTKSNVNEITSGLMLSVEHCVRYVSLLSWYLGEEKKMKKKKKKNNTIKKKKKNESEKEAWASNGSVYDETHGFKFINNSFDRLF